MALRPPPGATAGMRLISADAQEGIMASVRTFLNATGFAFKDTNARILSGEEEG